MKRVMFLGAGGLHTKTINQAQNAGFEVVAIEDDPSAAARLEADEFFPVDVNDSQTALEIARVSGIDGVLALNPSAVKTAAYISKEMNLVGLSSEAAFACRDIAGKRAAWENHNIPYLSCSDIDEWHRKMRNGTGVMVESIIQAGELRFQSIAQVNRRLVNEHYINMSHYYPASFSPELIEKIHQITNQAYTALGLTDAVAYTQLHLIDDDVYVLNLYPCAPVGPVVSTVLPHVYNVDFVNAACQLITGETIELQPNESNPCGFYYIDLEPGVLKNLPDIEPLKSRQSVIDLQIDVKPGHDITEPDRHSERVGYAVIAGDSIEQMDNEFQGVLNSLQYEMQT